MPPTLAGLRCWASRALAAAVFAFLDVVDVLLCFLYALLDAILEDSPPFVGCYCHRDRIRHHDDEEGVSDTLYARRSAVRDALLRIVRLVGVVVLTRRKKKKKKGAAAAAAAPCSPRWSDCGCKSCVAWRAGGGGCARRLHVVVKEPFNPKDLAGTDSCAEVEENAVFVHGFTSSSSFWAETVFHHHESSSILSSSRRLLAVDLLGFGQSPKPANCMYTLKDHVEAIETSCLIIDDLRSFHLVAHSMGCIIALALAAKHPNRVKSITLVAPASIRFLLNPANNLSENLNCIGWLQPYFLACEQDASQVALCRLAEKKLWPPLLFGSAVMSWYEHIGRTVCFVLCRNHLLWEWLIRLLTRNKEVDFRVRDLTRHTHHSAWHTMHNVICGGARQQDTNLDAVQAAGIPVMVIHGVQDPVVPVECSSHRLKAKLPHAELRLVAGCDHATVVAGREREFAQELTAFWSDRGRLGSQNE